MINTKGEGVMGAAVTVEGLTVMTGSNGSFKVVGVPKGEREILAWSLYGDHAENYSLINVTDESVITLVMRERAPVRVTFNVTVGNTRNLSLMVGGNIYDMGLVTYEEIAKAARFLKLREASPGHWVGEATLYDGMPLSYFYTLGITQLIER